MKKIFNKFTILLMLAIWALALLAYWFYPDGKNNQEKINQEEFAYKIELLDCNNKTTKIWYSMERVRYIQGSVTSFLDIRTNQKISINNGTTMVTKIFIREEWKQKD